MYPVNSLSTTLMQELASILTTGRVRERPVMDAGGIMRNERRPRILYLDGLRFVAITTVILFHYFSRWTPPRNFENLYPYGNAFQALFQYGGYGVQLFFIVSGFVIALTLYRCSSPLEFGIRRFARLWPAMALCSVLTLLLTRIIPNHSFHVSPLGLIPSLAFLEPSLLNKLFHTGKFDWIDGAYWSLFVEVRFYFLAALLYYWRRDRFAANAYLFSRMILALSLFGSLFRFHRLDAMLRLFFISDYLPWFLIGIAFFMLENKRDERLRAGLFSVGLLTLLANAVLNRSWLEAGLAVGIPLFVLAASRVSLLNRILSQRLLTGVGAASYSLYLLHQNIGTAFIGWLGNVLNFKGHSSAILAVLTALLVIIMAKLIYAYWERPMDRLIVTTWQTRMSRRGAARPIGSVAGSQREDGGNLHQTQTLVLPPRMDDSVA
jgi:peptidoglycan/LPS O-acetylase OafA/YrhL